MNRNRILKITTLMLVLTSLKVLAPVVVNADWNKENNSWYYADNSGDKVTGWQQIEGNWYYMWSDGTMATNTWVDNNSQWYYMSSTGAMAVNTWVQNNGNWYYVMSDGGLAVNTWRESNGKWYYLNSSGMCIIPKGELTYQDAMPEHEGRTDLALWYYDRDLSTELTYTNINMTDIPEHLYLLTVSDDLAKQETYIDEVKQRYIGKVLKNKYMVTDIKYFTKTFTYSEYQRDKKLEGIQKSNLYDYKSNAPYVYDRCAIFAIEGEKSWIAVRAVIEFQEV